MNLKVKRLWKKEGYTIGKLYIDDVYFCDTLEDRDRGLTSDMTLSQINKLKVHGKTAIPTGKYKVTLTMSSRFGKVLPLLNNVPGYSGVRIHSGNTAEDTEGCILCGVNKEVGKVLNSRVTMTKLMERLKAAKGEIWIEIC